MSALRNAPGMSQVATSCPSRAKTVPWIKIASVVTVGAAAFSLATFHLTRSLFGEKHERGKGIPTILTSQTFGVHWTKDLHGVELG